MAAVRPASPGVAVKPGVAVAAKPGVAVKPGVTVAAKPGVAVAAKVGAVPSNPAVVPAVSP
ncbi:hypothetical protein [Bradyrhizobium elkanii]|uniref:hypothetical protein n=1 Tax=Bradyrhizobium elkanii TaxID=29448 RepID=UPI00155AB95D|nr:hypothetical protein [Bradyrhizobium elkanii]